MADADEAAPSAPSAPGGAQELDDETQDFRFLSQLTSADAARSLPRRGEKDFEPYGSTSQDSALDAAQAAMHSALAQPRVHTPKAHVVGLLDLESRTVSVHNPRTVHFRTIGRADSRGVVHLRPEEALYLLERGSLEIRWEVGGREVSLGLQSAYALLIGQGVSAEEFAVYAGLRRSGYIVTRAPEEETRDEEDMAVATGAWLPMRLVARLWESSPASMGPLVKPGLYRNYNDVYRQLAVVPFYGRASPSSTKPHRSTSSPPAHPLNTPPSLKPTFWVWKPTSGYKKSAPGPPDYRVVVLDARESDTPTLGELDALLSHAPVVPPPEGMKGQMYQRLKHGWRSVLLAVVDCGVVSYLRVADARFGGERLYEGLGKRGPPKKGGKGGNKGKR